MQRGLNIPRLLRGCGWQGLSVYASPPCRPRFHLLSAEWEGSASSSCPLWRVRRRWMSSMWWDPYWLPSNAAHVQLQWLIPLLKPCQLSSETVAGKFPSFLVNTRTHSNTQMRGLFAFLLPSHRSSCFARLYFFLFNLAPAPSGPLSLIMYEGEKRANREAPFFKRGSLRWK